jgi:hypothetical protein
MQCALSPLHFLLGGGYLQQGALLLRTLLLHHTYPYFVVFPFVSTHQTTPLSDIFLPLGILRGSPLHQLNSVSSSATPVLHILKTNQTTTTCTSSFTSSFYVKDTIMITCLQGVPWVAILVIRGPLSSKAPAVSRGQNRRTAHNIPVAGCTLRILPHIPSWLALV